MENPQELWSTIWRWTLTGLAGAAILAIFGLVLRVQVAGDVAKRVLLSLAALSFKRCYGVGGVYVLATLAVTANLATIGIPQDSLEWIFLGWLLSESVEEILLVALLLPLAATIVAELTFFMVRWLTPQQPIPFSFESTQVEVVKEKSSLRRHVAGATVTDEGSTERATEKVLVPMAHPSGGLKQIIGCFTAQAFTSHFFGYSPYSGFFAPNRSDQLAEGRRAVVLAKPGDALDFEWLEFRAFQMKRVTDSCWILVRDPVSRAKARRILDERTPPERPPGMPL